MEDDDHQPSLGATRDLLNQHFPDPDRSDYQVDPYHTQIMTVIIILNCLEIGASTQWGLLMLGPVDVYLTCDIVFATAYIVEVIMKLKRIGAKTYFTDERVRGWNITDFALTVVALGDIAIRLFLPGTIPNSVTKSMGLLRVLRLVRILRLLQRVPSLTITIGGLWGSLSTLGWVVFALMLIIYVFAVLFVEQIQHDLFEPDKDPYVDLFTAMATLTDVVVLNAWTETIPKSQLILLVPFYLFALLSAFGISNVIIGVMVDATADTKRKLEWSMNRERIYEIGMLWEEMIHQKGLSRTAIAALPAKEHAEKHKERRAAVNLLLEEVIKSDVIAFPPGVTPHEVRMLLDKNGHGHVSHEDFTLGLGRIMLADPFQQSVMSFINQAVIRRGVAENQDATQRIEDAIKDLSKRLGKLEESVPPPRESIGSTCASSNY